MTERRALVTGGAGFIGSHVVERLRRDAYHVEVIDTLRTGRRENLDPRIPLHVVDVMDAAAREIVTGGEWSVVLHLASRVDIPSSVADPDTDVRTNILGTLNLLEGAKAYPGKRRPRFVFTSSGGAVYGNVTEFPTPEHTTPRPDSPYGVAKFASEMYVDYYRRAWGIEALSLRLGNVYGPRQHPSGEAGVVAVFAEAVMKGAPMTVYGDGTQTRDFVYVADVAEAIVAAGTGRVGIMGFPSLNIATGIETRIDSLVDRIQVVARKQVGVRFEPERKGDLLRSVLAVEAARGALGWKAQVGIEKGLEATYKWFAGQRAAQSVVASG